MAGYVDVNGLQTFYNILNDRWITEKLGGISADNFSGILNLKNRDAIREAQLSLKDGESKTYIISDEFGNFPSPNIETIYLDNMDDLMDLLYRGNDLALRHIINNGEAYYKYLGIWSSENIRSHTKLPKFHLQTAKVGDLVTIIRHDFDSDVFYSNYIDFNSISNDNTSFQSFKALSGFASSSDGEFIKHLIKTGNIYSAYSNPREDSSVIMYPLAINGKVQFYTAQITPNTQKMYSGNFWPGNMTGPGIYSYITSGRPAGSDDGEYYIGYVSPNGTQSLVSMLNPYKVFVRSSINDEWINITEQIFGGVLAERFPSIPGWLVDVDNCLDNGVHPTCSTQSILNPSRSSIPAPSDLKWSNSYFTCLVNRTSTNDGSYDTIEQTAYGRDADTGQIYKRIIFQGPDTQYGPWINIVSGGTGTYPEINHGTSDTTFTLTPNTFHIWGEVPSLYISFAPEIEGIANEYIFQFSSGSTPTVLNINENIKWADLPSMSANKTYQISVLKGLASIIEFS